MLLVVLLIASATGFTAKNTTSFWEKTLNTTLHFQAYAGLFSLTQAINKSIGITPRVQAECSIIYLELLAITLWNLLPKFL